MSVPTFCKMKPELWDELASLAFAYSSFSLRWCADTCRWIFECTMSKQGCEIMVDSTHDELEVAAQDLINQVRHYDYVIQKNPKK